jgi:hypothetical protein
MILPTASRHKCGPPATPTSNATTSTSPPHRQRVSLHADTPRPKDARLDSALQLRRHSASRPAGKKLFDGCREIRAESASNIESLGLDVSDPQRSTGAGRDRHE